MNRFLATFPDTWRALLVPRRAIAILVVALPLIVAQAVFGGDVAEVALATTLAAAFFLLGPATWRALFPTARLPPPLPVVARLALFAALGALCVLATGVIGARVGIHHSFLTSKISLVISGAFFLVGGFGLGRDIELEQTVTRERSRAALLEREAEQARLLALKNHLDPHFIFNTLNAIAEWCRHDGEVAERAILQLSDILRAVLAGVQAPTWPLAKERALAETLAALHRLRDPGLFTLEVRVAGDVDDVPVPPLLLLPLVENAFKHGPGAGHRGRVALWCARDASDLVVVVENPGPYRGPRAGGEGVRMIERRLALHADGRGTLALEQIDDASGPRTRATLRLPLAAGGHA